MPLFISTVGPTPANVFLHGMISNHTHEPVVAYVCAAWTDRKNQSGRGRRSESVLEAPIGQLGGLVLLLPRSGTADIGHLAQ